MYKNALAKSRKNNNFERDDFTPSAPPNPLPGRENDRFRPYTRNNINSFYDTQKRETAFRLDRNKNIVYPVADSLDQPTLDEMLKVAQKEFGNTLIVQGDPEFCRRIVERADALGIQLVNDPAELDRIREEIRLEKSDLSDIQNFLSDSMKISESASAKNAQALEKSRAAADRATDQSRDDNKTGERMR